MNITDTYNHFLSFYNIGHVAEEHIPNLSAEELETLKLYANKGEVKAQFIYAFLLLHHASSKDEFKSSISYFKQAAIQDEPLANFILAQFYENGSSKVGIEQDIRDAYEYNLKSAQKGYTPAKYCLGYFHEFVFLYQDYAKALFWYESALNDGYQEASQRISWLKQAGGIAQRKTTNERLTTYFEKGLECLNESKEEEAVGWFLKVACQGVPGAIKNVAHALNTGKVTSKRDQETIIKLLLISYDRFDSGELFEIARHYLLELHKAGIGVDLMNDNPILLLNLGLSYVEKGQLLMAKELWERAAELGCSDAIANLAIMYENGGVVAQNNEEAFRLATKAYEIDQNGFATKILATYYQRGLGVSMDAVKALCLFEESANKGYVDSMNLAANCYYNGIGTNHNMDKAIEWWGKAAAHGNEYAREMLVNLEKNNNNLNKKGCMGILVIPIILSIILSCLL